MGKKKFTLISAAVLTLVAGNVFAEENNTNNIRITEITTPEYEKELANYNTALENYNKEKEKYNNELQKIEDAKKQYEKDLEEYNRQLEEYNKEKEEAHSFKTEYEEKLKEWEVKKKEHDKKLEEYNRDLQIYKDKQEEYNKQIETYKKNLENYYKQIETNKESDRIENERRKIEYENKLKEIKEESEKPGKFLTEKINSLTFIHEPKAEAVIDVSNSGALALLKIKENPASFWNNNLNKLSSDKLDNETLKENKLSDFILKSWDSSVTTKSFTGSGDVDTYSVIVKKNQPFKVTYTNIQNSKYNGHKIGKVEYIYEVLETGSDSDTMTLSIAKDPTTSVWLIGKTSSSNHNTRVKLTPIFYDENGNKIIPSENKPIYLGMGSMNASWRTYDSRTAWFVDGKNLFKELMGFEYDRGAYSDNKFYNKYQFTWKDRYKHGYQNTPDNQMNIDWKSYWNEWDSVVSTFDKKIKEYMSTKYGEKPENWPSQYREIVYNISNGEFIKLNNSLVEKHPDGYYSDKSVDSVGGWDNPQSPKQYIGAGVIKVTEDNFSLEFGSTTPKIQRFALNTTVADFYIVTKPKLELINTPDPEKPTPPIEPEIEEPTPLNPIPNEPDSPKPFEKPEPKKPELNLNEPPTPPIPPKEPEKPIGGIPVDPPVVEIPEFNGGVPPIDPPVVEIPEFNGGVPPIDPPVVEIPEFNGGVPPLDPPVVEIPEFNGGVPPLDPPVVEIPELKIDNPPVKPIEPPKQEEKPKTPEKVTKERELPNTNSTSIFASLVSSAISALGLGYKSKRIRK